MNLYVRVDGVATQTSAMLTDLANHNRYTVNQKRQLFASLPLGCGNIRSEILRLLFDEKDLLQAASTIVVR